MTTRLIWTGIGFAGQTMFTMRFLVQWITSERAGRSLTPTTFWYFSVLGGLVLLLYAIHRQDPVFIIGQAAGLFIYARNLQLIRQREAHRA